MFSVMMKEQGKIFRKILYDTLLGTTTFVLMTCLTIYILKNNPLVYGIHKTIYYSYRKEKEKLDPFKSTTAT